MERDSILVSKNSYFFAPSFTQSNSYSIMCNKTEMLLQKTVSPHVVYGISTVGAMIPSLYLRTTEVILFVSF